MSDIIIFVTGQKRKKKKKKRKRSTKYCLSVFRKNDLISWKKNNVRTRSKDLPNCLHFFGTWEFEYCVKLRPAI